MRQNETNNSFETSSVTWFLCLWLIFEIYDVIDMIKLVPVSETKQLRVNWNWIKSRKEMGSSDEAKWDKLCCRCKFTESYLGIQICNVTGMIKLAIVFFFTEEEDANFLWIGDWLTFYFSWLVAVLPNWFHCELSSNLTRWGKMRQIVLSVEEA